MRQGAQGRRPNDDGTVLFLTIGLSVVLLLLIAVVVDVSAVILAKRGVSSAVDGAAVAAAQRVDTASVDSGNGLDSRLPLDEGLVRDLVATYQDEADDSAPGLRLVARVDGASTAVVDGYRTVTLPFGGWLEVGRVQVHATARAQSPVLP